MERYQNIKKGTKAGLWICFVLVVINLIVCLSVLVQVRNTGVIVQTVVGLVLAISIAFYAISGYKKPHGNMLRYLMFFFGVCTLAHGLLMHTVSAKTLQLISLCGFGFATLLSAYISGRLQKIEKNKLLMLVTGAVLTAACIITICISEKEFRLGRLLGQLSYPIYWAAICLAYTARYEEHKAAGLEDKVNE